MYVIQFMETAFFPFVIVSLPRITVPHQTARLYELFMRSVGRVSVA